MSPDALRRVPRQGRAAQRRTTSPRSWNTRPPPGGSSARSRSRGACAARSTSGRRGGSSSRATRRTSTSRRSASTRRRWRTCPATSRCSSAPSRSAATATSSSSRRASNGSPAPGRAARAAAEAGAVRHRRTRAARRSDRRVLPVAPSPDRSGRRMSTSRVACSPERRWCLHRRRSTKRSLEIRARPHGAARPGIGTLPIVGQSTSPATSSIVFPRQRRQHHLRLDRADPRRELLLLGEDLAVHGADGAVVGAVDVAGQRAGDGRLDEPDALALLPVGPDDDGDPAGPYASSPHRGGRSFFCSIPAGAST